jgi:hypothetical protein
LRLGLVYRRPLDGVSLEKGTVSTRHAGRSGDRLAVDLSSNFGHHAAPCTLRVWGGPAHFDAHSTVTCFATISRLPMWGSSAAIGRCVSQCSFPVNSTRLLTRWSLSFSDGVFLPLTLTYNRLQSHTYSTSTCWTSLIAI